MLSWTGREARALRLALRLSVRAFAEDLGVAVRTISKWEAGGSGVQPRPDTQALLDTTFERADEAARRRFSHLLYASPDLKPAQRAARTADLPRGDVLQEVELLRRGLTAAMNDSALTPSTLDDWEQTVARYGVATRNRPAGLLLGDLRADLAEVYRDLPLCRSASSLRRLTRVIAQLSGLMCLTLVKLDERTAFRGWARTARLAAQEVGDRTTASWILAQEAYGHYYCGDLAEAIHVAQGAQLIPGESTCVGAALAAPLEARAQAALGRRAEARAALGRAEDALSRLNSDQLTASAFGYSESQLRFHEGNAWTHLGDTARAWRAQQKALELCPPEDFMDQALTQLDRASCLARDGDVATAMDHAAKTITSLSEQERKGIITVRGHEIMRAVPARSQNLPAVREFRDLLLTTGRSA